MDLERIVVGRSATRTKTFTFTPTGTPTVSLTRMSDGSAVSVGSVTGATTDWTYTIPADSNTLLDTYVETWTAVSGGLDQTFTTYVEVAGEVFFTLAEARAVKPLDQTSVYSDAQIRDMRTTVEQSLENACHVAFVPRYHRETLSGDGGSTLMFSWPKVTAIRDVTVDTTTLSAGDLALLTYNTSGIVNGYTWTAGYGNVTVGYEHGHPFTPPEVKRAALILLKMWLTGQNRPIDDRAVTFNAAEGGTYSLAVPGRNGSVFGHPDVDVVVQRYSLAVGVA